MKKAKNNYFKKKNDEIKILLLKKFAEVFGDNKDAKVYFAPGRVTLIGEHTDFFRGTKSSKEDSTISTRL